MDENDLDSQTGETECLLYACIDDAKYFVPGEMKNFDKEDTRLGNLEMLKIKDVTMVTEFT